MVRVLVSMGGRRFWRLERDLEGRGFVVDPGVDKQRLRMGVMGKAY